jgi:hypothetical protein
MICIKIFPSSLSIKHIRRFEKILLLKRCVVSFIVSDDEKILMHISEVSQVTPCQRIIRYRIFLAHNDLKFSEIYTQEKNI